MGEKNTTETNFFSTSHEALQHLENQDENRKVSLVSKEVWAHGGNKTIFNTTFTNNS
jgi:hypothetical protein